MISLFTPIVFDVVFLVLVHTDSIPKFQEIKHLTSNLILFVFAKPAFILIIIIVFVHVFNIVVLKAFDIVHFLVLVHLHEIQVSIQLLVLAVGNQSFQWSEYYHGMVIHGQGFPHLLQWLKTVNDYYCPFLAISMIDAIDHSYNILEILAYLGCAFLGQPIHVDRY